MAPEILSVGYPSVSVWLHGGGSGATALSAFGVKTIAFVIAVSAGVLGGTFAPSLFIGAAIGAATGHALQVLLPNVPIAPGAYALVGLGAFFAGLLRSPIAAVLIAVEVTHGYGLIAPLMLAVSLSVAISRRVSPLSMVEQQMMDEGFHPEFSEGSSEGDRSSQEDPSLRSG
jgi:CIC family chloride channel protein